MFRLKKEMLSISGGATMARRRLRQWCGGCLAGWIGRDAAVLGGGLAKVRLVLWKEDRPAKRNGEEVSWGKEKPSRTE
ncbi:hypothetical protein NL676_024702 [Syzygium grande]|nr:hypothetical protein NL676_024702 [Syzygium grande]